MITIETLLASVTGIDRTEVEHWVALDMVRPAGRPESWQFQEIDVARLRLIHQLTHDLQLQEDALPVVLHLLDQLYDTRRRMRRLRDAMDRTLPPDMHRALLDALLAEAEE